MIRYVERTGTLHSTDLGRTASHFYIKYSSIEVGVKLALALEMPDSIEI